MSVKVDFLFHPKALKPPFKRAFDILFSLSVLLLLAPLYLLIALAIKISSPGPALYKQARIGKGGVLFTCYKFRTMHTNADHMLEEILRKNRLLAKEWQIKQKLTSDPRIFALGSFLRKFSLDELPQFYNVLKGDLSVVGPRPYMFSQLEKLGRKTEIILSIKPGITGLWQTSGRSTTSFQRRILLDSEYVEDSSLWLDLKLILKTCIVIFNSKNAY